MRSLKGYLIAFVLVVVLPSLSFGLVVAWQFSEELFEDAEDNARRLAHAGAEAMAAQLREQITALTVLARVPPLASSLEAFYRVAEDYHQRSGYHVTLSDGDGNRLLSTRRPFGAPLPPRSSMASVKTAVETGRPNVSDLFLGRMSGELAITIDIPLSTPAGVRIASLSADPMRVSEPLRRIESPEGWLTGLVDSQGTFIYRSLNPELWIGRQTRPELVAAIRDNADGKGVLYNRSVEGFPIHNIFERVPGTGWAVLIGLPESVLYKPLWRPIALLATAALGTLILTALLAYLMARPLHRAALRLTEAAEALGRGDEPGAAGPPAGLPLEFERVARELRNAAGLIHRKQAHLAEARGVAERANDARTRFLASVSHDLRQPLMAQRLLLHVATAQATMPLQVKLCRQMEATLAATETMLARLMDFAALETGNVPVRREVFRLDQLTRAIAEENDEIAADKGLAIGLRTFPCWAESDPVLLGRILRNLVANGVRYTVRGGLLVGIRRRGGRLRVEVWDTGIGIPEDQRRVIFEEFRQLDNPERNRTKGQGLGLAIVAKTAELLGHPMSMRSVAGRGSVFAIEVPEAPPRQAETEPPDQRPAPASTILLVEDDEVQASALATLLGDLGHRVVIAHDADAALEAGLEPLELILTDYRLPGHATGVELIGRLRRAAGRTLPALIVTGDTQQTIILEAAAIGCEVLHKPCAPQEVFHAIARALAPAAPACPTPTAPQTQ